VAAVAGDVVIAGGPVEHSGPGGRDEFGETPASVDRARIRLVPDEAPFGGPLAAVDGALRSVDTELAIVVGGDMPRLVPAVLDAMLARLADAADIDAVVLRGDATRLEVLPVALRVGPATAGTTAALRSGERSLVRFLDRLRCAELPASEWRALDPEGRTVLDVDIPGDLDRFRGRDIR
jgi:molybdopterin-guanine dinucleotide biosynthesis protein A